jgi:PAS domain S-box-containing protein
MRSADELALIASIADGLPCGVWVAAAPDGRFVYSNAAFDEIMGMGPVADIGVGQYTRPYGIYGRDGALYPENRLPFVRALQERKTVVVDDLVIHRRDGRRVYVRAFGKPLFDAAAAITHVAIAFFDITREVEAQEASSRAEDRLRRVVGNAPIVLFALDRDGRVTFVDGHGLGRLGRRPQDFLGRLVQEIYPDDTAIAEWTRRALAGETVSYIAQLPPDAVYETRLAPLRDESGERVGAIGVATDVTDRHKMQARLARAERLASVGLLAAGVAHEVNNPLSFVIGNLDRAAREIARGLGASSEEARKTLEPLLRDAREGAERVKAIVRDLKLFSRVGEPLLRPIDVRGALDASIAMAHHEIRHRAKLVTELAPVPAVMGDEGRLGQVFLNLLVNAAHAIREGAAEKNEIVVATRVDGDGHVRIEISDTGVGIAPEQRAMIFDPFFTTKEIGVGTGLGLSICHALVTELGGHIEVESLPGQGSTFAVVLPPAGPQAAVATPASATRSERGRRGGILVIDDEPLILKVVADALGDEHEVTCEGRGDVALARIRNGETFDAIVCDLMMPQVTGMDLHGALLEIAPKQAEAMIFLTGGAFTPHARAFLDRIPNIVIEKPFDTETLCASVRRVVGA